jgi:hypothetical protein
VLVVKVEEKVERVQAERVVLEEKEVLVEVRVVLEAEVMETRKKVSVGFVTISEFRQA